MSVKLDQNIISGTNVVEVYTRPEIDRLLYKFNRLTERARRRNADGSSTNWEDIFGRPNNQAEWETETGIESYTDEKVDDRVSNLLIDGTGLTKIYDDVANTLILNIDNPFDPNGTYANLRAQATTFGDVGAYSTTQIDNFFSGTTSITGYNKSNWDAVFTNALRSNDVWGVGTPQTVAVGDNVSFGTGTFTSLLTAQGGVEFNNSNRRIYGALRDTRETVVIKGNWNEAEIMGRVWGATGGNLHIGDGYSSVNHTSSGQNDEIRFGGGYARIELRTNGTERMIIGSNGDIGIGTNPSYKLDVAGGIRATLPTSAPATANVLWNDNGTVKIS